MATPLLTILRPTAATLRPLSRTLKLTTVGLTGFAATHTLLASRPSLQLHRCDSLSATASDEFRQYTSNAKTPVVKNGKLNPGAVRQISAGSIAGLGLGLAVSMFSKSLALLIGLLVVGVQALESRGIHIVPYGRLQSVFKNTNIRSAIQDNAAFKLCFGATFALAAFAEF